MRQFYLFVLIILIPGTISIFNGSYSESNNETNVEFIAIDDPCRRPCIKGAEPMRCKYNFALEWYQTLSKACYSCPEVLADCYRPDCIIGDGLMRTVLVVNRMLPGPTIEVCLGDEIIVDVENMLLGETTTIHWHGHHQRGTPYMDGVPFVTQCPIHPGTSFRYHFRAANAGTHFWHSHTGMQRSDGAFGAFIVNIPEEDDPHAKLFDYDLPSHVMSIIDWDNDLSLKFFVAHHHSVGDNKPATMLINGLGLRLYENDNSTIHAPIARFVVEQGYRYRFRIINAEFLNCPVEMSVENHTLTVISSDGNDFQPIEVNSLVSYAGERFDFVINADQPKDLYWIKFKGLMDCDERFTKAHQVAILQYKGMSDTDYPTASIPTYEEAHTEGIQLNPLNKGTESNETVVIPQLKSLSPWDSSLQEKPDFKYFISYDFYKIDNPHFHKFPYYGFNNITNRKNQVLTPQFNHISMKLLSVPLLSARDQINSEMFCNASTVKKKNCETSYCQCTHVVQVKLNSIVEIILIDKGFAYDANHPFHLHGHAFRVVGMERLGSNVTLKKVKDLDTQGMLKRNLVDAPIKDTVTVPDGGYTIIRFNASNPGYWLFHCHIEFHVEVGMSLIFKFGEDSEMPPVPDKFPQCGSFMPLINLPSTESLQNHWWMNLFKSSAQNLATSKMFLVIFIFYFFI